MQIKHTAARILTVMALAAPLSAVGAQGDKPKFSQADANGDGKVSLSEAVQAGVPKEEARREDIDNNKKLSKTDWDFIDMNPGGQSSSGSSSS